MAKYSFRLPNADYLGFPATPQAIVETASKAEELGFDALFVNDHVIVDGSPRNEPWRNVYDPLMVLSYVAATTSKIMLGTSVLIMPYRNPIVTAKMVATLDQMSGGRAIIGVGSGWNQAEYDALGVPFRQRGSRTTEYLELWKKCWEPGPTTFRGRYFSFENMHVNPKPLQKPHPAIWAGGSSLASLRRAARFAEVWQPTPTPLEDLVQNRATLKNGQRRAGEGAAPNQDELSGKPDRHYGSHQRPRRKAHRAGHLRAGGVRHEAVPPGGRPGRIPDQLQRMRQPAAVVGLHGPSGPGGNSRSRPIAA